MAQWDSIIEGQLYWCDTSRSNLFRLFSDKGRRPALVVAKVGDYGAIYPCSSFRGDLGATEWVGDVFGSGDTFVIFGCGLFFVPLPDLDTPGTKWEDWQTWHSAHREVLRADLENLKRRHQDRLRTPIGGMSHRPHNPMTSTMEGKLAEARKILESRPPPAPEKPKPVLPPRPRPRLSPQEEFRRAVDAILPYEILKGDQEESLVSEPHHTPRNKKNRG